MKKKILIDASLTGGRGPAKQAYEFVTSCKERGVSYTLLTNKSFRYKLSELGLTPDIILDVELTDPDKKAYKKFNNTLKELDFDLLVKFGARTASTYIAYKLKKPFVVVDGGLPDTLEEYPSLYAKEGYINAKKYFLTTHFPWKYPDNLTMENIALGTYPFSNDTLEFTRGLRKYNRDKLLKEMAPEIPELNGEYDILINLLITGSYVANPFDRKTYGAWLTSRQYDEIVGFVRRFITDLGIQNKGKALVFMDPEIYPIVDDIFENYPNIKGCFNKMWSYKTEIRMVRLSDVVVTRATNYVPNVAMIGQGATVTTPVPANGYMDEDTAAYQAYALGLTELIPYDDESYMKKFLTFCKDKTKQKQISNNLIKTSDELVRKFNTVDLILNQLT